jgi:hypothetical protein
MESWSMNAGLVISARDEDVIIRAVWEVVTEIERRIIRAIEEKKPFSVLSR